VTTTPLTINLGQEESLWLIATFATLTILFYTFVYKRGLITKARQHKLYWYISWATTTIICGVLAYDAFLSFLQYTSLHSFLFSSIDFWPIGYLRVRVVPILATTAILLIASKRTDLFRLCVILTFFYGLHEGIYMFFFDITELTIPFSNIFTGFVWIAGTSGAPSISYSLSFSNIFVVLEVFLQVFSISTGLVLWHYGYFGYFTKRNQTLSLIWLSFIPFFLAWAFDFGNVLDYTAIGSWLGLYWTAAFCIVFYFSFKELRKHSIPRNVTTVNVSIQE
jgi:hypothetical protein